MNFNTEIYRLILLSKGNRLHFSKSFLNILFIEIADKYFDSVKWIYLELQILVNTKVIEKKNLANAMELLIPFTFT